MDKDLGILLLIILIAIVIGKKKEATLPVGATNEETMSWIDYRGHEYRIRIHREIH